MSDNIAELGFAVDSKPLDDAKTKLGEVATEAGKTGKAVDDFNQKVSKTSGEASKAADGVGKIAPSMQTVESAAKRAGTSVEEMRARTAAFNAESGKLATSSTAAGTALGAASRNASAASPAAAGAMVTSISFASDGTENNADVTIMTEVGGLFVLSRNLAGYPKIPIRAWNPDTLEVTLFLPVLEADIPAGTELSIHAGCDLTREMCFSRFNNIVNLRAETFVPPPEVNF